MSNNLLQFLGTPVSLNNPGPQLPNSRQPKSSHLLPSTPSSDQNLRKPCYLKQLTKSFEPDAVNGPASIIRLVRAHKEGKWAFESKARSLTERNFLTLRSGSAHMS